LIRGEGVIPETQLPKTNEAGKIIKPEQARRQRRFEIQSDAYKISVSETEEAAQQELRMFIDKWEELEPKAVQVFQKDFELTFYQFNESLHRHIRTTNHLERLFREFRTKSDEIGAFPYETSCLTHTHPA
jgi:putative transposase